MKKKQIFGIGAISTLLLLVSFAVVGCGYNGMSYGGGGNPPPPTLSIQNLNSSTTPTSPVGFAIEINGSGFLAAPGKVTFTQGAISMDVVPAISAWSNTGIVAVVPAGNGITNFTVPGTVAVTVVTSGGTTNAMTLNLVATSNFIPSSMTWGTTTMLPTALTGLRAVAIPGSTSGTAFVIVTGGYNGANTSTVLTNTLSQSGIVGGTWSPAANPLPSTVAHHAMAESDPTNSLVASTKAYIYVIGGQHISTDVGGTSTVNMASVDPASGAVSAWTATTALPQTLMGASAVVHNGYLYVAGGRDASGNPVNAVYSAPVKADGTIGAWTTATNVLPKTKAFGTMFVYGGIIYYINGDPNGSISPNNQGIGDTDVYYSSVLRGMVGAWTTNGHSTKHDRAKGVVFTAFGQVISGEGVYTGNAGSGEMEISTVNPNNTTNVALNAWTDLAVSSQVPIANVYNAASFTSPLVTSTGGPRFLILGGQTQLGVSGPGGTLSKIVYINTAP
jgi:hypothetical protein